MSGGRFDYLQYRIHDIACEIEEEIRDNEKPPIENPTCIWDEHINEDFYKNGAKRFSDETIKEFKKGVELLKKAEAYANRIDYLLSGDDGEEEFHKRLKKDLEEIETIDTGTDFFACDEE